jgi:spoIIIJ-associated protein
MNDVKRRYFSGDTLQQALVQAANYFNLDPGYVAYRSLEKRHGFLKTRRKVMIEVDPDNPRRETPVTVPPAAKSVPPPPPSTYLANPAPAPAERAPAAPRERPAEAPAAPPREARPPRERGGDRPRPRSRDLPPRSPRASSSEEAPEGGIVSLPEKPRGVGERYPEATGAVAEAATKATGILLRIAGLELTPKIFQGEERLEVDLSGEDVDWCFADDGEILMAFEHLLPRMIRTLSGGEPTAVRVDCDNFHEIREERLRSLAQRVAEEVRRRNKPSILEPMNPGDRRIIHTTLADDPNVVTESEGDGYFKRIMVRPA